MPSTPTRTVRILLVDDHPLIRSGLAQLIATEPGLQVCAEAEDAPSALDAARTHQPDIAIVDLSLPGASGLELLRQLRAAQPQLPVLILSMHDESLWAERTLRAGARGYIMKEQAPQDILAAIRHVLAGNVWLSPAISARILGRISGDQAVSPIERLTDREIEVYTLIGQGLTMRQIAEALHVSVKTAEAHREHIKQKLSVGSANDLVRHATLWSQALPDA
ncbi:MAG: response regulator transcription factor [Candidatus Sumerlaeia bacterium]|nr:response regulator transcription factor [Candidatus Sumerlaeia bacterium]